MTFESECDLILGRRHSVVPIDMIAVSIQLSKHSI